MHNRFVSRRDMLLAGVGVFAAPVLVHVAAQSVVPPLRVTGIELLPVRGTRPSASGTRRDSEFVGSWTLEVGS